MADPHDKRVCVGPKRCVEVRLEKVRRRRRVSVHLQLKVLTVSIALDFSLGNGDEPWQSVKHSKLR